MEVGKAIYNILSNDSNVAPLVTTGGITYFQLDLSLVKMILLFLL
jgi:hypothetical protein